MKNIDKTMDQIANLCKNRGFIFAGSSSPAARFTAVWPTPGTTALWVWN